MKITYQKLAKTLQGLEKKFRENSTHSYSGATKSAIRLTDNFQCFALDTTTSSGNPELPVVIAVGANYTQGSPQANPLPGKHPISTLSVHPWVEVKLSSERSHFEYFFKPLRDGLVIQDDDYFNSGCAKEAWRTEYGMNIYTNANFREDQLFKGASGKPNWKSLPAEGGYHLVMTNFCPWITKKPWGYYRDKKPHMTQELISSGLELGHLAALRTAIGKHTNLWLGHGNFDIYYHFFTYLVRGYQPKFRTLKKHEWLFTSNSSQIPMGMSVCS